MIASQVKVRLVDIVSRELRGRPGRRVLPHPSGSQPVIETDGPDQIAAAVASLGRTDGLIVRTGILTGVDSLVRQKAFWTGRGVGGNTRGGRQKQSDRY